jgi:hypothetical protein
VYDLELKVDLTVNNNSRNISLHEYKVSAVNSTHALSSVESLEKL